MFLPIGQTAEYLFSTGKTEKYFNWDSIILEDNYSNPQCKIGLTVIACRCNRYSKGSLRRSLHQSGMNRG